MIPTTPQRLDFETWERAPGPDCAPGDRRQTLFTLGKWEIVLFKSSTHAYAVHSCLPEEQIVPATVGDDPDNPGPPRAITRAESLARGARGGAVACWNCAAVVPDEILTIAELYNG